MKKAKILFVTRAYSEHAGGMERLSFEFIAAAKKSSLIDARVLANHTLAGASLFYVRLRSALFALSVIPRALMQARSVDVVHLGDPVLAIAGWLIQKVLRKPVVVTVHGLDITYPLPLYQAYLTLFFRNFDGYFPISKHAQGLLHNFGITSNVLVLTPGIVDRMYDSSITREALASLLSVSPEVLQSTKILFTAGRLVPRKGHAWFIREVLPLLPQNVLYVIAGAGPAAADISAAIEDAKQSDRVRLLGRVSDEDLRVLDNTIDVFVQPNISVSGDAEGFGLVLLEAALCNRPVIASKLEGITDAIHDEKNGILVPAENTDAWVAAIKNALSGARTVSTARAYTRDVFSWDSIMQQYNSYLRPLVT